MLAGEGLRRGDEFLERELLVHRHNLITNLVGRAVQLLADQVPLLDEARQRRLGVAELRVRLVVAARAHRLQVLPQPVFRQRPAGHVHERADGHAEPARRVVLGPVHPSLPRRRRQRALQHVHLGRIGVEIVPRRARFLRRRAAQLLHLVPEDAHELYLRLRDDPGR